MVYKRRGSECSQPVSSVVEQLIENIAAAGRTKPHQLRLLEKQEQAKRQQRKNNIILVKQGLDTPKTSPQITLNSKQTNQAGQKHVRSREIHG